MECKKCEYSCGCIETCKLKFSECYQNKKQTNCENKAYNQALEDLLSKVKSNHYLLSDKINSTDYGMFTCGIEQAIDELKR